MVVLAYFLPVFMPFIVTAIVGTGVTIAASYLSNRPKKSPFDNKATTLAARGSPIPKLIGRRRLGYICAWAGNRTLNDTGGGGKNVFGGGGSSGSEYHESAWHLLAVGPVDNLYGIYQNGKLIYPVGFVIDRPPNGTFPILSRNTSPSGTTITLDNNQGTFDIFWGECDQPVNDILARTGVNEAGQLIFPGIRSQWPRCCYIMWHQKNLGASAFWPQLEYDIDARVDSTTSTLVDSDPWIPESYTGSAQYTSTGQLISQSFGTNDYGVNPAHAIWMLLTGAHPDGAGLDPAVWPLNLAAFEELGLACQAEHLPINLFIQGETIGDAISWILDEIGAVLYYQDGVLTPKLIRSSDDTPPTVTADLNSDPNPEQEKVLTPLIPERMTYSFPDNTLNFQPYTLSIDNDGLHRLYLRPKVQTVDLKTITDRKTAYLVVERKELERVVQRTTFKFTGSRECRLLVPGQAFILEDVAQIRLLSSKPDYKTGNAVEIEGILDQYAPDSSGYLPSDDSGITDGEGVLPDIYVKPFVFPASLRPNSSLNYMGVARVRANSAITGSVIYTSGDGGSTYTAVGDQDYAAAGGTLNAPMFASEVSPIAMGPTITPYNDDIALLPDLTGDDVDWTGGILVGIIDDEVFFIQSVTAVTGGYRLTNMIRGRYGSIAVDHAANAPCVLFRSRFIIPLTGPAITSGTTAYIKSVPFSDSAFADITTITPVTLEIPSNSLATITVTYPNSALTFTNGTFQTLTWFSTGLTGNVTVEYTIDGSNWLSVATNITDGGSAVWVVPNTPTSVGKIRVSSVSNPMIYGESAYQFTIV